MRCHRLTSGRIGIADSVFEHDLVVVDHGGRKPGDGVALDELLQPVPIVGQRLPEACRWQSLNRVGRFACGGEQAVGWAGIGRGAGQSEQAREQQDGFGKLHGTLT
jgi:hypothetical protein